MPFYPSSKLSLTHTRAYRSFPDIGKLTFFWNYLRVPPQLAPHNNTSNAWRGTLFTAKNAHLTYPLFSVSLSPLTSQVWNAAHTLTIIQIVTRPSTHTLFSFNKRWELTTVEHACAQTAHRGPESWDPWTWFRCFLTDYLSSTQDTLTAAKAGRDNS